MATYLINELTKPDRDTDFIDHLNIHVLPTANPDGYEYSRNSDRLWRKTRSDIGSYRGCKGVDPNRNWDFHWGGKIKYKLLIKDSFTKHLLYRLSIMDLINSDCNKSSF